MSVVVESTVPVYRIPLDVYDEMVRSGALEGRHVELLEGVLVEMMSPNSPQHVWTIQWLLRHFGPGMVAGSYELRVQQSLRVAATGSEPEPDIALLTDPADRDSHPASADLVIEVALSPLEADLRVKAATYAAAGVPDYWVVDLGGRVVHVHRGAGADGYRSISQHRPPESVAPLLSAAPPVPLAGLLP